MECGQHGMNGLLAQRHVTEGRVKGHERVPIPNLNLQANIVMEQRWKQLIVSSKHALALVSQFSSQRKCIYTVTHYFNRQTTGQMFL